MATTKPAKTSSKPALPKKISKAAARASALAEITEAARIPSEAAITADGAVVDTVTGEVLEEAETPSPTRCPECGMEVVEIEKNRKMYLVCRGTMAAEGLCFWYKEKEAKE